MTLTCAGASMPEIVAGAEVIAVLGATFVCDANEKAFGVVLQVRRVNGVVTVSPCTVTASWWTAQSVMLFGISMRYSPVSRRRTDS